MIKLWGVLNLIAIIFIFIIIAVYGRRWFEKF